jgi:CubicO group peptidase (beta-lactamase class C family)
MQSNESVLNRVKSVLNQALSIRIGSGMAAAWGAFDDPSAIHRVYLGRESHFTDSVICPRTFFDLASLTKILATTSLYMKWFDRGLIDLDSPYPGKQFTFRQLLSHTSGLPAWKPFYEQVIQCLAGMELVSDPGSAIGSNRVTNISSEAAARLMMIPLMDRRSCFDSLILAENPIAHPGEKVIYSDIGFSLLMIHAERVSGMSFEDLIKREIWSAIPGCGLHYRELDVRSPVSTGVAATEWCDWRGLLSGEVHDDNAWSRGGIAGHAGAFGTLEDVILWTRFLMEGKMVSMNTLRAFTTPVSDVSGCKRGLGFDFSSHPAHSPMTIGHLGFTGTSLWMDLDRGRFAILLTNRVHPSREDTRIRELRQVFHYSVP